MDKLIHFCDHFFNIRHIIKIRAGGNCIVITTADGIPHWFVKEGTNEFINSLGEYDESELKTFFENIQSFM